MASVSLIKADSYEVQALRQSIETLLAPLGGIGAFVKPGDRVLLKPNLLTGSVPTKECVTRPELVYCVGQMVQEVGGQPFMGDSPAFGSAKGVAKNNGYLPWLEELNIPVVEFNGDRYGVNNDNFDNLRLSKEAMAADVVINLPKVKSHMQLTMTMAVKNLFGCVPGKMKAWWHMEAGKDPDRFAQMLIATAQAINPQLTIVDGIIGHGGNGPSAGEPHPLGLLAASRDIFALDRALVDIVKVDPMAVPTIKAAIALGLCSDTSAIDFPLLTPSDLTVNHWPLPTKMMPIDFALPRVVRSLFKSLYIKFIKEPMKAYTGS
ncbi:MAG: DUF362 domain-containing protein [Synechococcaceae cyanobacterium RL_1_2]|nr:DUF362 domain-containing protein [Synechococcaceae cyanobacterium RL_1_2]